MARMLAARDSATLHLNLARRHQRLARRYQQASLVTAIQTTITALAASQSAAADKELDRQAAYDDVVAADAELGDAVRNLSGAAAAFDRDHIGAGMMVMLFPGGGFSPILDLPVTQKPATIEALATKVSTLGKDHALAPYAEKLNAQTQTVRDALTDLDTAVRAEKAAVAEEDIAKRELSRQYEHNYLAARQALGRVIAERLFVKANRGSSPAEPAPAPQPTP